MKLVPERPGAAPEAHGAAEQFGSTSSVGLETTPPLTDTLHMPTASNAVPLEKLSCTEAWNVH